MGSPSGKSQNFYAATIATIASTADSAASAEIPVPKYASKAQVQLKYTGHASGSGYVTTTVVGSLDGTLYETRGTDRVDAIVAGANLGNILEITVGPMSKLKVLKVHNGDPAQAITAVNVVVTFW